MKLLVINGPNLNLLGIREPGVYGNETYDNLIELMRDHAGKNNIDLTEFQSNNEGVIIDEIHNARGLFDGIIINPGAYTHYSYAIHDAIKAVEIPTIEVHISNIAAREAFRSVSVTASACKGQISGLGLSGYLAAMDYFIRYDSLKSKRLGDDSHA